jgi:DNA polymerase III subunit gamma/tau
MAYEVTATKKRPQIFDELAGQEFVVSTLKRSIDMGRIAHAYLFAGPRGVGKTSAARILAKALNCEKGPTSQPCNTCSECREISEGRSLDVIEIDGASNTSVNDVREIKDEVLFAPNSLRYKIYIIDEVHMLSNSAFNALLKTIEEPPPYIVFIFATTEIHKVPATIRSRCQQFNFRLISAEIIRGLLEKVAEELNVKADRDALFWIAKEATGSLRDAYTLFDQVVSFSEGHVTLERIREKLGLLGMEKINAMFAAMNKEDPETVMSIAEEVLAKGVSVEQMIVDLAEFFRNLLLLRQGVRNEGVLGYPVDSFPEDTRRFTVSQLESALHTLLELHRNIRFSLNQRYELELVLSRLSYLGRHISSAEMYKRLEALKKDLEKGGDLVPAAISSGPSDERGKVPEGTEDIAGGPPSSKASENTSPEAFGRELIQALKKKKLALSSALEKAEGWAWKGDALVCRFSSTYPANCVRDDLKVVRQKAGEMAGHPVSIEVKVEHNDEEGATASEEGPAAEGGGEAGIEMVRRVFKGEIIEGENL